MHERFLLLGILSLSLVILWLLKFVVFFFYWFVLKTAVSPFLLAFHYMEYSLSLSFISFLSLSVSLPLFVIKFVLCLFLSSLSFFLISLSLSSSLSFPFECFPLLSQASRNSHDRISFGLLYLYVIISMKRTCTAHQFLHTKQIYFSSFSEKLIYLFLSLLSLFFFFW